LTITGATRAAIRAVVRVRDFIGLVLYVCVVFRGVVKGCAFHD
jgi:hypothetical protein